MRNLSIYLIFLGLLISSSSKAQNRNVFPNSGNVGLNTNSPRQMLHLRDGSTLFEWSDRNPNERLFLLHRTGVGEDSYGYKFSWRNDDLTLRKNAIVFDRSGDTYFFGKLGIGTTNPKQSFHIKDGNIALEISNQPANQRLLYLSQTGTSNSFGYKFSWRNDDGSLRTEALVLEDSGNVGIGTTNIPSGYKLAVDGKAIMEELKIQLSQNWADYVFQEDYDLKSLEEVEQTIEEKGHLHNIASAQEIEAAGGIELGNITVNQQEKIEELFLHMIELNKELKALRQELKELKSLK